MAHSTDLRWRAVSLIYIYNLPIADVCAILGVSPKSARRWYAAFEHIGSVEKRARPRPGLRWPVPVYDFIKDFVEEHPCFYLEELSNSLKDSFPDVNNFFLFVVLPPTLFPSIKPHRVRFWAVEKMDTEARVSRLSPSSKRSSRLGI